MDLDDSYNSIYYAFVSYFDSNFESVKWHARLAHMGQDRINMLAKEGLLDPLSSVKLPRCESSLADKATIKPFGKASTSSPL